MPEMAPVQCHTAWAMQSTLETTPEMTLNIQRPLDATKKSKWWKNGKQREAEGYWQSEERQNWKHKGSDKQHCVSSC